MVITMLYTFLLDLETMDLRLMLEDPDSEQDLIQEIHQVLDSRLNPEYTSMVDDNAPSEDDQWNW